GRIRFTLKRDRDKPPDARRAGLPRKLQWQRTVAGDKPERFEGSVHYCAPEIEPEKDWGRQLWFRCAPGLRIRISANTCRRQLGFVLSYERHRTINRRPISSYFGLGVKRHPYYSRPALRIQPGC